MPFGPLTKIQTAHVEISRLRRGMEPPKKGDIIETHTSGGPCRVSAVIVRWPNKRELKMPWGWDFGDRTLILELTRIPDEELPAYDEDPLNGRIPW